MAKLVYAATLVCFFHYGTSTYSHDGGAGFGGSFGGSSGFGGGAYQGPLAAPVVLSNGHLADTNEVAAAKNAHYSALSSAKASSGFGSGYAGGFEGSAGYGSGGNYGGSAYNGPLAAPVVLSSGHLADTREVAAARNAHYAALLSAKSSSSYGSGLDSGYGSGFAGGFGGVDKYGSGGVGGGDGYGLGAGYAGGAYNGPLAAPVVLASGHLADTREVAAARNAHYAALLSAKSSSSYGNGLDSGDGNGFGGAAKYGSGGSYGGGAGYASGAGYGGSTYNGPLAAPVVLSSGYLADTRDVASAKGAHYVALSEASTRSGLGGYSGSQDKGRH